MITGIDHRALSETSGPNASARSAPRLGQEDFFKLLITQLRNQDPLRPLASGEFLSQVAQFSTVAGIQDLQRSFAELAGSLYSNQALQASALVGRTVYVPGPEAALADDGSGVSGRVELTASATDLWVGIYDSAGQLVRRLTLGPQPAGAVAFHWDGLTDSGTPAAAGNYTVKAEAMIAGQRVALDTLVAARVESVTLGRAGQGISLNLAGLGAVDFAQVRQIQ